MPINIGAAATFKQVAATPGAPPASHQSLYIKSDGSVATENSSGVEQIVLDGTDWMKQACDFMTTGNITLSGAQAVDGGTSTNGARCLVKNQTVPAQNGIYLTAAGSWTRTSDANTSVLMGGAMVAVLTTANNVSSIWRTDFVTNGTLGTSNCNWYLVHDGQASNSVRAVMTTNVSSLSAATTSVDGITLVQNDRVLLVNQTTTSQNGVYQMGFPSAGTGPLTRPGGHANSTDVSAAGPIVVREGTVFGGTSWKTTFKATDTLDTTAQSWGLIAAPTSVTAGQPILSGSSGVTGAAPSALAAGTTGQLLVSGGLTPVSWLAAQGAVGQTMISAGAGVVPTWGMQGIKVDVTAATTANITLSAPQTIDGVAVVANDRVLVKNQATASANGIYVVAAGAWTRSTDMATSAQVAGAQVRVVNGTTLSGTTWFTNYASSGTLGTTNMNWMPISLTGTYTPAWTSTGTAIGLGNATLVGNYTLIGNQCMFDCNITSGSTTTYGTTQYAFSMPFASINATIMFGTAQNGGNPWGLIAVVSAGSNILTAKAPNSTAGAANVNMSNTAPATWVSGANFRWAGTFRWI